MSLKTIIVVGVALAVLAAILYFTWQNGYNSGVDYTIDSITQDSVTTTIDTVMVKDTVFISKWYKIDAEIDTIDDKIVYSVELDTTVVANGDTLLVIEEDIFFSEGVFDIFRDIQIRTYDRVVTIIDSVFQTVVREVPADPPFYQKFTFGFIVGIVAMLITVIFL